MGVRVKEFLIDDLRIDVTLAAGRMRLDWMGNGRVQDGSVALAPFLEKIARDALSARAGIDVHIERMQFCNSATLAAVVRFVKRVAEQSVDLEVVFEPRHRWQQVLVETLTMFDRKNGRLRLHPRGDGPPSSLR